MVDFFSFPGSSGRLWACLTLWSDAKLWEFFQKCKKYARRFFQNHGGPDPLTGTVHNGCDTPTEGGSMGDGALDMSSSGDIALGHTWAVRGDFMQEGQASRPVKRNFGAL